jgi:hypothetical protein
VGWVVATVPGEVPVIVPVVGQWVLAAAVVGLLAGAGLGALAGALFGLYSHAGGAGRGVAGAVVPVIEEVDTSSALPVRAAAPERVDVDDYAEAQPPAQGDLLAEELTGVAEADEADEAEERAGMGTLSPEDEGRETKDVSGVAEGVVVPAGGEEVEARPAGSQAEEVRGLEEGRKMRVRRARRVAPRYPQSTASEGGGET